MNAVVLACALAVPLAPGPVNVEPWEWPEGLEVWAVDLDAIFEEVVIEIAAIDFVDFEDHTGPNPDGPEIGNGQINYAAAGEWLEYEVTLPFTSKWHITLEYANPGAGGAVVVSLMGQTVGPIVVPQTGGWLDHGWTRWRAFAGIGSPEVQKLRVENVTAADNGWTGDLRRILLVAYADKSP